jgi:hypothetical protein
MARTQAFAAIAIRIKKIASFNISTMWVPRIEVTRCSCTSIIRASPLFRRAL